MRSRTRCEKTGKFKVSENIRGPIESVYLKLTTQAAKYLRATAERLNLTMAQFVEQAVMQFADEQPVAVPVESKPKDKVAIKW